MTASCEMLRRACLPAQVAAIQVAAIQVADLVHGDGASNCLRLQRRNHPRRGQCPDASKRGRRHQKDSAKTPRPTRDFVAFPIPLSFLVSKMLAALRLSGSLCLPYMASLNCGSAFQGMPIWRCDNGKQTESRIHADISCSHCSAENAPHSALDIEVEQRCSQRLFATDGALSNTWTPTLFEATPRSAKDCKAKSGTTLAERMLGNSVWMVNMRVSGMTSA